MASTFQSTQSTPTTQEILAALEAHGCTVQQAANGGWKAQCPAHEDRTPSLSVKEGDGGKVLLHCHAGCSYADILAALGKSPRSTPATVKPNGRKPPVPRALPTGDNITTYHYVDADGKPAFAVVRKDTPDGKRITQWTPSGDDGLWLPIGPKDQRPLYNLPELLEWDGKVGRVVIVEGEKCAEAGKPEFPRNFFTTFSGGSQAWRKTDFSPLQGREVTLLADTCTDGRECMLEIAAHLSTIGAGAIRIGLPEGETKDDIVEWIEQGIAAQQLKKVCAPVVAAGGRGSLAAGGERETGGHLQTKGCQRAGGRAGGPGRRRRGSQIQHPFANGRVQREKGMAAFGEPGHIELAGPD